MKKIFIFTALTFVFLTTHANTGSGDISSETQSGIGQEELLQFEMELQDNQYSNDNSSKSLVNEALSERKDGLTNLLEQSPEEKDIQYIENLLNELQIKREYNDVFMSQIQGELGKIQEKIDQNNDKINNYKELEDQNIEVSTLLDNTKKENQALKQEVYFKENLINNLKNTLDSYSILEVKYNNLLEGYVGAKKESNKKYLKELSLKLNILYSAILIFFIAYISKVLLLKSRLSSKLSENFFAYYDLFYAISLVVFVIIYLFFVFPQLYILLVFVSGSIIWANAILISSFVSSMVIFRKFNIGDIIKMEDDVGKIFKITPLHTIVRKINDHGIIEKDEISIPNINLIKDKVTLIKNINEKDHHFSIIISLCTDENIFKIIDEIKDNILLKSLTNRPHSINKNDADIFKSMYEQIDAANLKIHFYWIGTDELNRKIEKKIIGYIKNTLYSKNTPKTGTTQINDEKKENSEVLSVLPDMPKSETLVLE